jgi:hypothetical protein
MTTEDITDSAKIDDDEIDNSRIITRNSPRKKAPSNNNQSSSTRRHSSRKTVRQTKSRIRLMCKLILIYENKTKIKVSF